MKNRNFANFIRMVSFLLIATVLFAFVSVVMERKTYWGQANYMAKLEEFYNMPENSLEYLCVGSSHAYCSVNPLEVWNDSGIKGFVLATQRQPLRASYHYIKEAFKTQSPKVVILEGVMAKQTTSEDAVIYDAIDPLKPSFNKFQMINNLVECDRRDAFYFNVLKYHTGWKELSINDMLNNLETETDTNKGYILFNSSFQGENRIPDYASMEAMELPEENMEALNDILDLVEENGAQLILMIAPYMPDSYGPMFKAELEWARENDVEVLDYALMLDEIGIDPMTDYVDAEHLDVGGAAKLSKHLSGVLLKKGLETEPSDAVWREHYNSYLATAEFQ